jgi:hypothetical protein
LCINGVKKKRKENERAIERKIKKGKDEIDATAELKLKIQMDR